jgi:hypothetical protein
MLVKLIWSSFPTYSTHYSDANEGATANKEIESFRDIEPK